MTDTPPSCFHCGLPVPPGAPPTVTVQGQPEACCCPGCAAVAQAIIDQGLGDYYRLRDQPGMPPGLEFDALLAQLQLYDHPEVQQSFVRQEGELQEAWLMLDGIRCAACVWLNEQHVRRLPGVALFQVNYATHRALLRWNATQTPLSTVLHAIAAIGYRAYPYDPKRQTEIFAAQRRAALRRLGVAGLGMMQVMMLAVAFYTGVETDDPDFGPLLRYVSLLFTLPVILYAAAPFFQGAYRDLRRGSLGMDVPVALALALAFGASTWATLSNTGTVYFDSVTMFVFLLLGARYLEMSARHAAGNSAESLLKLQPALATRLLPDGTEEIIPVARLHTGDTVRIKPGETVPADGVVSAGHSSVDEALLTGESLPQTRKAGDNLTGGTINRESPLLMQVTQVGAQTRLAAIARLLERAQSEKPALAQLADQIAGYFIAVQLFAAAATALFWYAVAPEQAFWVSLSVLVVTCPCALSLATPVALAAAHARLSRLGLLPLAGHTLPTLAKVTHLVFDKTGTLTQGKPVLTHTETWQMLTPETALQWAAALARHSEHPLAQALRTTAEALPPLTATDVQAQPGAGLEGSLAGQRLRLGAPDYVLALSDPATRLPTAAALGSWVCLGNTQGLLARFTLTDPLRPDAAQTVQALQQRGLQIHLLSGDQPAVVAAVAQTLGIPHYAGAQSPEAKLAQVRAWQNQGAVVAMIGDGVNDAPVLAGAHLAIAMGGGAELAQVHADAVLVGGRLLSLAEATRLAQRTQRVIWQNLAWALAYNLLAVPLAAVGWVTPWQAALGMSLSSLWVVANAYRLQRS